MAKTADTIAIYSRKSRYTGKGESIGNQIDLCREYIRTHYGDAAAQQAVVFEDEGFSGGNLNRPDFKNDDDRRQGAENPCHRGLPSGPHQPQHQRFFQLDRELGVGHRLCVHPGKPLIPPAPWDVP